MYCDVIKVTKIMSIVIIHVNTKTVAVLLSYQCVQTLIMGSC